MDESWRNRKTLILSRTDIMGLVTPAEYVGCVEQAYRMHGEGRFYMDPKGHIVLDKYPGEWEAMPSYIEEPEAAACKWVSIREDNEIAEGASIGTGAILEFGNRVGARSRIHSGCFLEMTIVEEDVFVGPRVVFTDDPHPMGCPRYKECLGGVTVRALARIGANATLLPGVVVGRNSLIGAGSVVTRNVPEDMVVAGNPARVIRPVSELQCVAGFYARPYEWAPYRP